MAVATGSSDQALRALSQRLATAPQSVQAELQASPSHGCEEMLRMLALCVMDIKPERHGALVECALRLPWRESEALARAVLTFVQELVSAAPGFVSQAVHGLVLSFLPAEKCVGAEAIEAASAAVLPLVHKALHAILRTCPLGTSNLYAAIKEAFPHHRRDGRCQAAYLAQTLRVLEYSHALRPRVLHLVVERLVELDVQIAFQIRKLEEEEEKEEAEPFVFDMVDSAKGDTSADELAKMRLNVDKLDAMMAMLLQFVGKACRAPKGEPEADPAAAALAAGADAAVRAAAAADGAVGGRRERPFAGESSDSDDAASGASPRKVARSLGGASPSSSASNLQELNRDPALALFESLVSAFRASVLHTYKCRCVQFVVFYVCSHEADFASAFVQLLLSQLRSDHLHAEARMGCAAYLASFLARARFVPFELVLSTLHEVAAWAAEYQDAAVARLNGRPAALDVHLHGTFYAAVQGLLYTLCYKHELLGAPEAAAARTQLGNVLHGVLHGELNPLKFAADSIVVEFEKLGVCDCAEVLAANERTVVPSTTAAGGPNRLEDFFPFDPLHGFKQTGSLVADLYQEWNPMRGSEPRDSNLSELSRSEDASESLSRSLHGMSFTPHSAEDHMGEHMQRRLAENRSLFQLGSS